jgi:O-antigen/teichoic acid export membrane protein
LDRFSESSTSVAQHFGGCVTILTDLLRRFVRRHAIKATAIAGLLGQVARPLISIITLPLLLSHLGKEGLGVWMIALSLIGLIGIVSAGLSASVITIIGRASKDVSGQIEGQVATAATILAVAWGGVLAAIFVPAALVIDWEQLLKLDGAKSGHNVGFLMAALAGMMAFSLVATVPCQIMIGRMQGYIAHFLEFAGVLAGAVGLIVALVYNAPLWVLGISFLAPTLVINMLGGLYYLQRARIPLLSMANVDKQTLRLLGKDSLRMSGYQSAYVVSSQSDLLLIGIILGAPAGTVFGIAQRVFSLPLIVTTTVNRAQWPAMARADAKGEADSLRRMFRRTLLIGTSLAGTIALATAVFYQQVTQIWLGRDFETDSLILIGMVAWVLVGTFVNTCDSLLRSRLETKLLMRAMMAMAAINLVATLILLPLIGAAGAIWGSVTGYTIALLVPYAIRLWPLIIGRGDGASKSAVQNAS